MGSGPFTCPSWWPLGSCNQPGAVEVLGSPVLRFVSTERMPVFSFWAVLDLTLLPSPAASTSVRLLTVLHEIFPKFFCQVQTPLRPLTSRSHPTWCHPWSSEAAAQTRSCEARRPCLDSLCPPPAASLVLMERAPCAHHPGHSLRAGCTSSRSRELGREPCSPGRECGPQGSHKSAFGLLFGLISETRRLVWAQGWEGRAFL